MRLLSDKKVVEFDERRVTVFEIDVESYLRYVGGEYDGEAAFILDNTDLSQEERQNLSIEAYNAISEAFYEVNRRHFESDGEKVDKKKS